MKWNAYAARAIIVWIVPAIYTGIYASAIPVDGIGEQQLILVVNVFRVGDGQVKEWIMAFQRIIDGIDHLWFCKWPGQLIAPHTSFKRDREWLCAAPGFT